MWEFSFNTIGQNKVEFFDYNRDLCIAVDYELTLSNNYLKVTNIDTGINENKFKHIIGKTLKLTEFKDINYLLNLK